MNQDTETLQTLLERAEAERDAALGHAQRAAEQAQRLTAQAEQLRAYRDDYRRRAPATGTQAASIELIRVHRDFMLRLEHAIEQQRRQLESAQAVAGAAREALLAQELRVASVRKLLDRRLQALQRNANRIEQRGTDEAALRATWARRANPSHSY